MQVIEALEKKKVVGFLFKIICVHRKPRAPAERVLKWESISTNFLGKLRLLRPRGVPGMCWPYLFMGVWGRGGGRWGKNQYRVGLGESENPRGSPGQKKRANPLI